MMGAKPGRAVQQLLCAAVIAASLLAPRALRAQEDHIDIVRLADFVAANPKDIFIPVYVAARCGTLYLTTAVYMNADADAFERAGHALIGAALRISKDRRLLDNPSEGVTTLSFAIMKAYSARMTDNEARTGAAIIGDDVIESDLGHCHRRAAAVISRR